MTQEEMDEVSIPYSLGLPFSRMSWLASRRLLREKVPIPYSSGPSFSLDYPSGDATVSDGFQSLIHQVLLSHDST